MPPPRRSFQTSWPEDAGKDGLQVSARAARRPSLGWAGGSGWSPVRWGQEGRFPTAVRPQDRAGAQLQRGGEPSPPPSCDLSRLVPPHRDPHMELREEAWSPGPLDSEDQQMASHENPGEVALPPAWPPAPPPGPWGHPASDGLGSLRSGRLPAPRWGCSCSPRALGALPLLRGARLSWQEALDQGGELVRGEGGLG